MEKKMPKIIPVKRYHLKDLPPQFNTLYQDLNVGDEIKLWGGRAMMRKEKNHTLTFWNPQGNFDPIIFNLEVK